MYQQVASIEMYLKQQQQQTQIGCLHFVQDTTSAVYKLQVTTSSKKCLRSLTVTNTIYITNGRTTTCRRSYNKKVYWHNK